MPRKAPGPTGGVDQRAARRAEAAGRRDGNPQASIAGAVCPLSDAGRRGPVAQRRAQAGASPFCLLFGWAGTPGVCQKVTRRKAGKVILHHLGNGYVQKGRILLLTFLDISIFAVQPPTVSPLRRVTFWQSPQKVSKKGLPLLGPYASLRVPSFRRRSTGRRHPL